MEEILNLIPQRPPFLFVDKIISYDQKHIVCQKLLTGKEAFFQGHFPGNPIMPGVLLQECVFQTGALLIGKIGEISKNQSRNLSKNLSKNNDDYSHSDQKKLGVVTRIEKAKFKNFAKPGDLLEMEVSLDDVVSNASFMSGKITTVTKDHKNKTIMVIKFSCAVI